MTNSKKIKELEEHRYELARDVIKLRQRNYELEMEMRELERQQKVTFRWGAGNFERSETLRSVVLKLAEHCGLELKWEEGKKGGVVVEKTEPPIVYYSKQ